MLFFPHSSHQHLISPPVPIQPYLNLGLPLSCLPTWLYMILSCVCPNCCVILAELSTANQLGGGEGSNSSHSHSLAKVRFLYDTDETPSFFPCDALATRDEQTYGGIPLWQLEWGEEATEAPLEHTTSGRGCGGEGSVDLRFSPFSSRV